MTSTTITGKQSKFSQCAVTAITTGAVSVILTTLLVAGIAFAIHIAVYQCFYKPKLMLTTATAVGSESHNQIMRDDVTGSEDGIVYDVVDERVGTTLEMKENEAYSVDQRVGGLKLMLNEAYGVTRSTGDCCA